MEKEKFIIAKNINYEIEVCDLTIKKCTECIEKLEQQGDNVWLNGVTLCFNGVIADVNINGSNIPASFVYRLLKESIHEAKKK